MATQRENSMPCGEFDTLLSAAIDAEGSLSPQELESFQKHAAECQLCGPLFAEVKQGRQWLKSLKEVEPPATLVANILVATTGLDTTRLRSVSKSGTFGPSWLDRVESWASGFLVPTWAFVKQPRFAMSFGMVFFSLSVLLTLTGVKVSDVRHADLRPTAIKRNYYETSGRLVKYYENIRFVYEIESRVREFKKVTEPAEEQAPKAGPGGSSRKDTQHTNDTSQEPEQKQERNYSQEQDDNLLASFPMMAQPAGVALEQPRSEYENEVVATQGRAS